MRIISLCLVLCLCNFYSAQETFKVVSWNIHLLPAPVFAKSKKKVRVNEIVNHFTAVDTTIDVLLFQEVFHPKRRKQLIDGLHHAYPYHTPVINPAKGRPFKTNSGLIIFSKTPFVQMGAIKYDDCTGSDCMAYKGAQFIHTVWNNIPLLLVNTHLNSQPPRTIALQQANAIVDELIHPYIDAELPILMGGDFNINCNDTINYQRLLTIVKSENTAHEDIVDSPTPTELTNTLDYIFVYNDWLPAHFELDYIYKYLIGPKWDETGKKKVYGKTVGFSDHHPVILQLSFHP